jgi:hypothetical protein
VQINLESHPSVTKEQALDPNFSLKWAAEEIAKGRSAQWTACNCYSLVKTRVRGLPKQAALKPSGPVHIGSVAIFNYNGVKHFAYVKRLGADSFTVFEANYEPCLIAERTVSYKDAHLIGFYSPMDS